VKLQPLKLVIEHYRRLRDDAVAVQARVQMELAAAQRTLHTLVQHRQDQHQRARDTQHSPVSTTQLLLQTRFSGKLEEAITLQTQRIADFQHRIESCRIQVLADQQRFKAIESIETSAQRGHSTRPRAPINQPPTNVPRMRMPRESARASTSRPGGPCNPTDPPYAHIQRRFQAFPEDPRGSGRPGRSAGRRRRHRGGAANRFSDVIAKAGEQQEAAQQPSANDVLPVVPGIPLNLPPQAAGSIGARSDAPVGSKRLLPPDVRVGGDVAAGEGSRDTTAAAKASPDTTAAAEGSPDATALLTPPSGDSSRGVPVGDVKTGSRGSTEAAGGSTGQAAAVQAVPSSPNTPDGPAAVAAHAPPGKTGTPALDATPAATPAAATPAPAVTEAAPATTASTPTTTASATTAAATATTAAAAAAARPVPTAAGAEGSGADRGARLGAMQPMRRPRNGWNPVAPA
jgi:flagellar export protein FliJ